jgi:uncharacterized protein
MKKLVTLLLSDGKPGHYHLAEGICAALARKRELAITRVEIRRPRWLPARLLSALTNAGEPLARSIPRLLGVEKRPLPACDLIVSAGGDTLAANVVLSRTYRCPNIFYGSLRRYRPEDFSLVLTSYSENAHRPRHAMVLKPSAFDPVTLPDPAVRAGSNPVIGLLIGGDSGTIRYGPQDWDNLIKLVSATDRAADPRWIVSNSRRTPDTVSDRLAAMAAASHGALTLIDVRKPGAPTLPQLFAQSNALAVTVDSSSMVSEAIWALRPVAVLSPKLASLPPLEQSYRKYLSAKGWLTEIDLDAATPQRLIECLATIKPMAANPLETLAAELQQRLPDVFV